MRCAWEALLGLLPQSIREDVDRQGKEQLQELRFRIGTPPELLLKGGSIRLRQVVSAEMLQYVVNAACRYSPWTATTAASGYITAQGGHRIGICGEAILRNGQMADIKNLTSLCIRIARDFPGIGSKIPMDGSLLIIGRPGCGKTTLLRIINRIITPDAGRVLLGGKEMTADDVAHIGYMPEERGLYKKMKVGEQAIFFARLKGLSRREAIVRLKEWFIRLGIESWWNRKVEDLSKGMAQKVQFITTVLHEPKLLIFDEPFSGFDPINANILKQEILRLRDKGATVIFSTHNMSSVEEICDHITLINKSRNILSGSVDEVRHRFGENVFEVVYSGQSATFESALQPMAEMLGTTAVADTPYTSTRIRLKDGATVRESISAANEAVELRSFREVIPSMNEIFIRAVEGSL